jgi:type IV pilus assembly protein PilC
MVILCRQFATSFGAGIPILRSLELTAQNLKDQRSQQVLRAMYADIRRGATFAEAARRQDKYLPPLFIELIQSGEIGGRLDVMLRDLATYYEDRLTMRRTIVQKTIYPCMQLMAAWFLGSFSLMIIRIMGRQFNLTQFLHRYLIFQLSAGLLALTGFVACLALARAGIFNWIWGFVTSHIWPLAPVTRRFAMARVFRSLSFLLGSGVPVEKAVESAAATASNPYIERDILTVIPRVRAGYNLAEAFAPCAYMTPQTREMMVVAEESGRHEEALRKASQYQLEEASHAVNVAVRVGEVFIILAVSGVVGFIVISFYSTYLGNIDAILK